MSKPLIARIVPKEQVTEFTPSCQICMTPLKAEHGGDANLRYGVCTEHLTKVLGEGREASLALLLARGVIMVCYYSKSEVYKVRVEVRSARRSELLKCMRDFDVGRIYKHSAAVSRWSSSALADLHKLGSILMPLIPEFGIFLQSYVIQPDKNTRSAYAEAFMKKMNARTVHLLPHL